MITSSRRGLAWAARPQARSTADTFSRPSVAREIACAAMHPAEEATTR